MKHVYLSLSLMLGIATAANAQKQIDKEVETNYLQLPSYDLSTTDPSTITSEFASGDHIFGKEQLGEHKSICVPKGGGIKDAVEITTYHYVISTTTPESFLVCKDQSGNVVYASQLTTTGPSTVKFGFDKCEYAFSDAKMKKEYEAGKTGFQNSTNSAFANEQYQKALALAKSQVTLSYQAEKFEVNSAKGKGFDYSDLEGAFDNAMNAYESIGKTGPNSSDFAKLKECIAVWNKALGEADLEDKDARINQQIARGLHQNVANAHMYMYEMEEALKHAREALNLWGNMTTNATTAWKARIQDIEARTIAVKKNEALSKNLTELVAKAEAAKASNMKVNKGGAAQVDGLKSDFQAYQSLVFKDNMDSRKDEYNAAVATGGINKYEKYTTATAGGKVLNINTMTVKLSGDADLTEFPADVCNFGTDLKQASITGFSEVKSVPACIGNLTVCTRLSLANCGVTSLPAEIGQMTELQTLVLTNCPITALPAEIQNCANLKSIVLKGTKLDAAAKADLAKWCPDVKIKY